MTAHLKKFDACTVVFKTMCDATMLNKEPLAVQKNISFLIIFSIAFASVAQIPDMVYKDNVKCVRFHMYGNQESIYLQS